MKKLGVLLLAAALVMSMTEEGTGIQEKVRRHPAETPERKSEQNRVKAGEKRL